MNEKLSKLRQDLFISLIIFLYFVFIVIGAFNYPPEARLFPLAVGIPAIIICLFFLMYNWQVIKKFTHEVKSLSEAVPKIRMFVAFGLGVVYLILIYFLGYFISTIIMGMAIPYFYGKSKLWLSVLFTGVILLSVWLVFSVFLNVTMPPGILLSNI